VRAAAGPETAPIAPRSRVMEITRCVRLATRAQETRTSLKITTSAQSPINPRALTLDRAEEELSLLADNARRLVERRQALWQRNAKLADDCEQLSRYRGVEFPLDGPGRSSFLHFVTGNMPSQNFERLQNETGNHVALFPLTAQEGRLPLLAMTTSRGKEALESALAKAGFQVETLPKVHEATNETLLDDSLRHRERLSEELKSLDAELAALAREHEELLAKVEDLAERERRLLEAEQGFPRTGSAILITGWVPADDASALGSRIRHITAGRCALETTPPEGSLLDQTPVLLRHPSWLRPFDILVTAYGLPNYQEIEPTLFVALSYTLMFGIMFGDLGHGAILALAGAAALLVGRGRKLRDLGLLLVCGGLSSMVFGLTYGSLFGVPAFKKRALWHDPLEGDPMTLMTFAIGLGVVLISLGLVLNIINRFRRGDLIGGFLDKFGLVGVWFYWGVLLLLGRFEAIQARGLVPAAIGLFVVLPLMAWCLKEPLEYLLHRRAPASVEPGCGLFAATTESLVGTFEAVLSYLANTISFVRLGAYAMSHAALLAAAFVMAAALRHSFAGGESLGVAVIILGNIVAILLEGVVASVQALRLEYYEFFGKFFSGTGQAFEPFRLTSAPA
ncbi:MAG TPA: V-type ATPase 116kDa subunit family protein, partial [Verrucomicrobiae bacterium]|nr:V-type ATPase 116kDa subunit family protein [Verrucomicrobiae bacterium]